MNLRNKPCACGSGKKYKKCCWKPQQLVPSMIPPKPQEVLVSAADNTKIVSRYNRSFNGAAAFLVAASLMSMHKQK